MIGFPIAGPAKVISQKLHLLLQLFLSSGLFLTIEHLKRSIIVLLYKVSPNRNDNKMLKMATFADAEVTQQ